MVKVFHRHNLITVCTLFDICNSSNFILVNSITKIHCICPTGMVESRSLDTYATLLAICHINVVYFVQFFMQILFFLLCLYNSAERNCMLLGQLYAGVIYEGLRLSKKAKVTFRITLLKTPMKTSGNPGSLLNTLTFGHRILA